MDRQLSQFEWVGLRLHLILCAWCRRYGHQLRFLRTTTQPCEEHQVADPQQTLSMEARERIKQKLQSMRK